jgi:hypothetical protein
MALSIEEEEGEERLKREPETLIVAKEVGFTRTTCGGVVST